MCVVFGNSLTTRIVRSCVSLFPLLRHPLTNILLLYNSAIMYQLLKFASCCYTRHDSFERVWLLGDFSAYTEVLILICIIDLSDFSSIIK